MVESTGAEALPGAAARTDMHQVHRPRNVLPSSMDHAICNGDAAKHTTMIVAAVIPGWLHGAGVWRCLKIQNKVQLGRPQRLSCM